MHLITISFKSKSKTANFIRKHDKIMISKSIYIHLQVLHLIQQSRHPKFSKYEGELNDPWYVYEPMAIELFFRQSKTTLSWDKYQIRTRTGVERYWLIMSLVHYMCCTCTGKYCAFEDGYHYFRKKIKEEQITALYQNIRKGMSLEDVLKMVG